MSKQRRFTFVVAVNNRGVLESNLLSSSCLRDSHVREILTQEGFASASKAYNDGIDRSRNEFIVFVHQDIILPKKWLDQIESSLDYLEHEDPNWGVLGCYGETRDQGARGHVYSSGLGIIGEPFGHPVAIQSLDEIVLILRKSSGLRFDDNLPHFHLYGTDICLRAELSGRKSYAIPAFCTHNTNQNFVLPKEFYECYRYIKRAWKSHLPIQTSCIRITKLNLPMYKRRMREIYHRSLRQENSGGMRARDVRRLVEEVNAMLRQNSAPDCALTSRKAGVTP
jgi:hypothetical protein